MEKILFNIDILCNIFQYLNLEEQLKSIKVCTQYRDVIMDYIWKTKYTKMQVTQTCPNQTKKECTQCRDVIMDSIWKTKYTKTQVTQTCANFLLSNEIDYYGNWNPEILNFLREKKEILNKKEFKEFIPLICDNIKTLALIAYPSKGQNLCKPLDFCFTFDNRNKFKNLTSLKFKRLIIAEEDIKLLKICCLNLDKLCLDQCFNIAKQALVIGDDIQMESLQSMKMLKSFQIVDNSYTYKHTNELLTNLNMKQLKISGGTFKFHMPYNKDEILASPCEALTIGEFCKQSDIDEFNNSILTKFNHLQKLVLISTYTRINTINENFFIALDQICNKLKYLKLINFRINNFIPINNLNELSLERIPDGLTWNNLKQILCDMKLKSFTSARTSFNGTFEYFDISTTLEYLKIYEINFNMKKLFEMNAENLKNLSTLIYNNRELWINLRNCPKLQTLKIVSNGKTQQFLEILKHSSIINLKILPIYMQFDRNDLFDLKDIKTNLLFITIHYDYHFKYIKEFWFNLLSNNLKLKIMIRFSGAHINSKQTKTIIDHPTFPKRLKCIKICGFIIGVKELNDHFEATIDKITHYHSLCTYILL